MLNIIFFFIMIVVRDMLNCRFLKGRLRDLYRSKIMIGSKREYFLVLKFRSSFFKVAEMRVVSLFDF